jgi:predicted adenine nucleotide alpha hydrolase (AANH) superfamily ATPase
LECLCPNYEVTLFFYNPNISDAGEYRKRRDEVVRLVDIMPKEVDITPIGFREGDYEGVAEDWLVDIMPKEVDITPTSGDAREFSEEAGERKTGNNRRLYNGDFAVVFRTADGEKLLSQSPDDPPPFREGGPRCLVCYEQRLAETARVASAEGYDYFATTLTTSPHKNAAKINEIGSGLVSTAVYLPSDFKKKGGYQRSIELSKQYGLYRQRYCGCVLSINQRENRS